MEQALHEGDSWDFESKNVFIRLHCTWIQRRITDCKTLETSRLPTLRLRLCPLDAKITGAQSSPAFGFPAADLEGPLYSVPKYPVPFPSFPEAFLFPKPAEFSSFTFQLFLTFIFRFSSLSFSGLSTTDCEAICRFFSRVLASLLVISSTWLPSSFEC